LPGQAGGARQRHAAAKRLQSKDLFLNLGRNKSGNRRQEAPFAAGTFSGFQTDEAAAGGRGSARPASRLPCGSDVL